MTTITVSIGRNVGTVPMSEESWQYFRAVTGTVLREFVGTFYVTDAVCVGHWDGVAEESRTWVGTLDREVTPFGESVTDLLGKVARSFGQDAIAVTTGTTVLAGLQPATV